MPRKSKSLKLEEPQNFLEETEGEVIERKATFLFTVRLDDGRALECHLSRGYFGRRTDIEKITPQIGDRVWIEISPFDTDKGRILSRKRHRRV